MGKISTSHSRFSKERVALCILNIFLILLFGHLSLYGFTLTTWEWPRSTPEQQGLDSERLTGLVELIRGGKEFPDLHSLLIVRNGYLVLEEYFGGYSADKLHTLQSVSKSYTSALIGIAVQKGEIMGVDEKILDIFIGMKVIKNMDDRKASMRLQDLLTMRSGTDYREGYTGSPHSTLNSLDTGWDQFYLNRPMVRDPGTHFQYDSGGVILMSSILKSRTGMHADGYAQKYLFNPLEIVKVQWLKNKEGHPHTGGGLYLIPRDMAKFGLLYLHNGRWNERQIVPSDWVKVSVQKHVNLRRTVPGIVGYGYLWWILSPDPDGSGNEYIYAAMGFRAQYIFVIPEHDMVVVVTGGTRSAVDQIKPVEFLYSHILPAIRRIS